jgi:hypothetical protein
MRGRGTALQLDVYEIAYLAGGPDRLVDTAVVALVEAGRIRVQPPGRLAVADPTRRHPVEAAVLDAVGTRGHRSVDVVRWRLADDDRVRAIGRRLITAGLLSRWTVVRRRTDRAPIPTAAGRHMLQTLVAAPPSDPSWDGGTAVSVALHGRERVSDELGRSLLFGAFPVPTARERAEGLRRRLDAPRNDPFYARGSGGDAPAGGGWGDGGGAGGGDGGF